MMLSASAGQFDEATVTNWPESVTNRQDIHPQISQITQIFEKKTEGGQERQPHHTFSEKSAASAKFVDPLLVDRYFQGVYSPQRFN